MVTNHNLEDALPDGANVKSEWVLVVQVVDYSECQCFLASTLLHLFSFFVHLTLASICLLLMAQPCGFLQKTDLGLPQPSSAGAENQTSLLYH